MAYQGKRLAQRYRKFLTAIDDKDVKESAFKGYHKLLSYKDEYEVARLLLSSREKAQAEFDGDFKMTFNLAPPMLVQNRAGRAPDETQFGPGLSGLCGFWPLEAFARHAAGSLWLHRRAQDGARADPPIRGRYEGCAADADTRDQDAVVALAELPLADSRVRSCESAERSESRETPRGVAECDHSGRAPMAKAAE